MTNHEQSPFPVANERRNCNRDSQLVRQTKDEEDWNDLMFGAYWSGSVNDAG